MEALLPAVDANDEAKTLACFRFFAVVLSSVPALEARCWHPPDNHPAALNTEIEALALCCTLAPATCSALLGLTAQSPGTAQRCTRQVEETISWASLNMTTALTVLVPSDPVSTAKGVWLRPRPRGSQRTLSSRCKRFRRRFQPTSITAG